MQLRSLMVAGVLAAAGVAGSAGKADAQVYFNLGYGSPYVTNGFYPGTYYSSGYTPYYGGYAPAYVSPYPTWTGSYQYYNTPYYSGYSRSYYQSPSVYGPGGYNYRYRYWR